MPELRATGLDAIQRVETKKAPQLKEQIQINCTPESAPKGDRMPVTTTLHSGNSGDSMAVTKEARC